MEITQTENETETVVHLVGEISHGQIKELRGSLFQAVNDVDVVIDARGVTDFDDTALTALSAARSRAKWRSHRLVVVDEEDGRLRASLRRTGLHLHFPVYRDPAGAAKGLSADRLATARKAELAR